MDRSEVEERKRAIEQQVQELAEHNQKLKEQEARGGAPDAKGQQELADRQREVKKSVQDVTPHLDLDTNGKPPSLYSGKYQDPKTGEMKSNRQEAERFCDERGGGMLERTKDGQWLDNLGSKDGDPKDPRRNLYRHLDEKDANDVWCGASEKYAQQMKEPPHAFVPEKPRDNSVFASKEAPACANNSNTPTMVCYHQGLDGPQQVKASESFVQKTEEKSAAKGAESQSADAAKQPAGPDPQANAAAEQSKQDAAAKNGNEHSAAMHGGSMSVDQRKAAKAEMADASGRNGAEASRTNDKNKSVGPAKE